MKRLPYYLFCIIIFISAILRFYKLDSIPPGINRDEGSVGYTAYSLLKTGKDEYGRVFPLSFESFGDWKLPLYIYGSIPFIAAFGTTTTAVRLFSTIAGIASVGVIFFLAKKLFQSQWAGFIAMTLLAINPWSFFLSRVESESNVAVFFILVGLTLLLYTTKKYSWFLICSAIFFALTYVTYHGTHITTTLLVMGVIPLMWPRDKYYKKQSVISVIVFLTITGVILSQTLLSANKTKISGVSFFSDPTVVHVQLELPRNQHINPSSIGSRLVHNRLTYAIVTIFTNYIESFSAEFLFLRGGTNHAHNMTGAGNLLLIEAPLLLLGFAALLQKRGSKSAKLIIWWLIIAPAAASITKDAPHTNRMSMMFPALILTSTAGILWIREILSKRLVLFASIIIIIGYMLSASIYFDQYYNHFPILDGIHWGKPYEELAHLLETKEYKDKKVIITHPEYSPYIFLLYYNAYDPASYQKEAKRYPYTSDAFIHVSGFNRFSFKDDIQPSDVTSEQVVVTLSNEAPASLVSSSDITKKEINLPSGKSMFTVFSKKQK